MIENALAAPTPEIAAKNKEKVASVKEIKPLSHQAILLSLEQKGILSFSEEGILLNRSRFTKTSFANVTWSTLSPAERLLALSGIDFRDDEIKLIRFI